MIKLKVTRSQLQVLVNCFNPAIIEKRIKQAQSFNDIQALSNLFSVLEISETITKKFVFTISNKYKISLKYANGAAMFIAIAKYEQMDCDMHTANVLLEVRNSIHKQLYDYQVRFNNTAWESGSLLELNSFNK